MSRYRFMPDGPNTNAASAPAGRPQTNMVSGGVYEVAAEWAERLCGIIPGQNGGPCLVPVPASPTGPVNSSAAAEFIGAVSAPTSLNPETPPAASAPETSGPVKRQRASKPRSA